MPYNKKAAVPETITWIVATVVIIVILVFSIFVASLLGKTKNLSKDFEPQKGKDLINVKTASGYLLTEDDSGQKVFEQIFQEGDLNDFNGPLGVAIFKNYEKENYQKVKHYDDGEGKYIKGVWLRLQTEPVSVGKWQPSFRGSIQEDYFKQEPMGFPGVLERFWLGESKYVVFYFG